MIEANHNVRKNYRFLQLNHWSPEDTCSWCPDNHIPDIKSYRWRIRKLPQIGKGAVMCSLLPSWNTLFLSGSELVGILT